MKLKDSAWIYISLLTLATAVVWFFMSLRTVWQKPTTPEGTLEIVKDINPNLDSSVINSLKLKRF